MGRVFDYSCTHAFCTKAKMKDQRRSDNFQFQNADHFPAGPNCAFSLSFNTCKVRTVISKYLGYIIITRNIR